MSSIDLSDVYHFILFQHGVWGACTDFNILLKCLFLENDKCCNLKNENNISNFTFNDNFPSNVKHTKNKFGGLFFENENLTCLAVGSNGGFGTHQSTCICACKALEEFIPVFNIWLDKIEKKENNKKIFFSCVGHSFGGIIMREIIYLLLIATESTECKKELLDSILIVRKRLNNLGVILLNFITIATPHCGVIECLRTPLNYGAWIISKTLAQSVNELLLKDNESLLSVRLIDSEHIKALKLFHRRTLFSNLQKDIMVGFLTSSLLYEDLTNNKEFTYNSTFSNESIPFSKVIQLPALHNNENISKLSEKINNLEEKSNNSIKIQNEIQSSDALIPQKIARALREELDWRVIILRYNGIFPIAHVACLGRHARLCPSPQIVQRVAQEIIELI